MTYRRCVLACAASVAGPAILDQFDRYFTPDFSDQTHLIMYAMAVTVFSMGALVSERRAERRAIRQRQVETRACV